MSDNSGISWCDATWNPVVGCSRVSQGCVHCYAETMASRIANVAQAMARRDGVESLSATQLAYRAVVRWERGGKDPADLEDKALPKWSGRVRLIPDKLDQPLRWKRPRRIFVNSMSDLFHEGLSDGEIAAVFGVMAAAPQHTFFVLTKRPERAAEWFRIAGTSGSLWCDTEACSLLGRPRLSCDLANWPLPNVWPGTSVENQETADERIPHLLQCPASVRFVSYEPALGPVEFRGGTCGPDWLGGWDVEAEHGPNCSPTGGCREPCPVPVQVQTSRLDWIIFGGESGTGARPCHIEWARSVRDQCRGAGTAFFMKQGGRTCRMSRSDAIQAVAQGAGWTADGEEDDYGVVEFVDRHGEDLNELPEDLRIREFPSTVE